MTTETKTKVRMTKQMCCICRRPIPEVSGWTGGNNAQPVMDGRCCYVCNDQVVLPARIRRMMEAES